jgi:hypothetical protein
MPKPSKRLIETAYHEAGHAVAAVYAKRPFAYVTIVQEADSLGHLLPKPWANFRPDCVTDLRTNHRIEQTVRSLLAAGVAAERFAGRYDRGACSSDWKQAVNVASYLVPASGPLEKYLDYLLADLRVWIRAPHVWIPIKQTAELLLAKQTIKAAAVRKIVRELDHGSPEMLAEGQAFLDFCEAA